MGPMKAARRRLAAVARHAGSCRRVLDLAAWSDGPCASATQLACAFHAHLRSFAMSTVAFAEVLPTIFRELVHGSPDPSARTYVLNQGDRGLLASLDRLSSAAAS